MSKRWWGSDARGATVRVEGAEEFALEQGVEVVPAVYFFLPGRWQSRLRARDVDHDRRIDRLA